MLSPIFALRAAAIATPAALRSSGVMLEKRPFPPAFFLGGGGGGFVRLSRMKSRSEEHTSALQSLMRTSYAVFCLKKKILKFSHKFSSRITLYIFNTIISV